jgi:hypothetical protein
MATNAKPSATLCERLLTSRQALKPNWHATVAIGKRLCALFAVVLLVVAGLATRLGLRGGKQARTLLQRGANLSGPPLVPFRRHDLAAFILNPVLCARRKLFEGPLDRRGLLHGCVPRPFIWHGLYVAVFSTTDTKSHRFLLSPCCCTHAPYQRSQDAMTTETLYL